MELGKIEETYSNTRHWLIVAACSLLMVALAIGASCLGFFMEPVTSDLGYSRTAFTMYFSISTIIQFFTMPIIGKMYGRFGIKKVMLVCAITSTLGLVALSYSTSLFSFYISGALLGSLFMGGTLLAATVLINTWFVTKKGMVMGVVMSFSGLGAAIFGMFLPGFITANGWRAGYMLLAVCFFISTVPSTLLFVKNTPQSVGLKPYGFVEGSYNTQNTIGITEITSVPYSKAIKSPLFYILYAGVILLSFVGALTQHIPAHLDSIGIEPTKIGGLFSILMIAMIFAKIMAGILDDKIGTMKTAIIFFGTTMVSFALLANTSTYVTVALSLVFLSFALGTVFVLPPLITGKIFGQRDYAGIWSIMGTAIAIGHSVGTPLWGMVYDSTGSYNLGFYGMIVILILVLLIFSYALKWKKLMEISYNNL